MTDLFICNEFDGSVGEDSEECCGVATVETEDAGGAADFVDRGENAGPGAGVFDELGIGGLEEDLDTVEGRN